LIRVSVEAKPAYCHPLTSFSGFKVHPSKEFRFGSVFKVLWSEPLGEPSGGYESDVSVTTIADAKYGQEVFHKIRRFVVVNDRKGHCVCLPILTYGGKGTWKKGVHPDDHAVIYSSDTPPETPDEKLNNPPIRVKLTSKAEKLDRMARINYAKVYTVEHNVKVLFIGNIHNKSLEDFIRTYNEAHQPIPNLADLDLSTDTQEAIKYEVAQTPNTHTRSQNIESSMHSLSLAAQTYQGVSPVAENLGSTSGYMYGQGTWPAVSSQVASTSYDRDPYASQYQLPGHLSQYALSSQTQHEPQPQQTRSYHSSTGWPGPYQQYSQSEYSPYDYGRLNETPHYPYDHDEEDIYDV
jgi:hypothetical protein